MARFTDRTRALELRKEGMSYSQIKEQLGVGKGTLSLWLRSFPLSEERIRELRDRSGARIERYRETMRRKREKRFTEIFTHQKDCLKNLTKEAKYIAGLFLYWGEGSKTRMDRLVLTNTDPAMLRFFLSWLRDYFSVPRDRIRVKIQIYSDMNKEDEIVYWSRQLAVPEKFFNKTQIKQSKRSEISHKGSFGHGTCQICIYNARLAEKILIALKVLQSEFSLKE